MPLFRLPKTSRWIIICAVLLFIIMLLYRVVVYLLFADLFTAAKPGLPAAFLLGTLFDLRIIAIATLIIFGLSFWPGIHYFKTKVGKRLAIWMYGITLVVLHIFYMADIVHLKCFQLRLQGSIISELAKHTPKGSLFISKVEWLPMLLSMLLLVWLFVFLITWAHQLVSKIRGTDNASFRIAWQAGIFIFSVVFIYGGIRPTPLSVKNISPRYNAQAVQLAVTPVESLIATLPATHNR